MTNRFTASAGFFNSAFNINLKREERTSLSFCFDINQYEVSRDFKFVEKVILTFDVDSEKLKQKNKAMVIDKKEGLCTIIYL